MKNLNFARLPSHLSDKGIFLVLKGQKDDGRRLILEAFVLIRVLKQEWLIDALLPKINAILGDDVIRNEDIY